MATTNCGNYFLPVSQNDIRNGWVRCSCGKVVKIRNNGTETVFIPRHNEPIKKETV